MRRRNGASGSEGYRRLSKTRLMSALREGKKASGKSRVRTSVSRALTRKSLSAFTLASCSRSAGGVGTKRPSRPLLDAQQAGAGPPRPCRSRSSVSVLPSRSRRAGRCRREGVQGKVSIAGVLEVERRVWGSLLPDFHLPRPFGVHRLKGNAVLKCVHRRPRLRCAGGP